MSEVLIPNVVNVREEIVVDRLIKNVRTGKAIRWHLVGPPPTVDVMREHQADFPGVDIFKEGDPLVLVTRSKQTVDMETEKPIPQ